MPWNLVWPLGSVSVKANEATGQQNTAYIKNTMGHEPVGTNTVTVRDHFWNVGSNEDGRHRFVQSPAFTVGGNAADPVIGSGMSGVLYLKTTNSRVQGFYRNANGIYQYIPAYLTGSVVVGASMGTVVAVPANVYGEIFMYTTAQGKFSTVTGFFRSGAALVESWALTNHVEGSSSASAALKFGNGSDATGLNIRARADDASSGLTWNYKITYRAI